MREEEEKSHSKPSLEFPTLGAQEEMRGGGSTGQKEEEKVLFRVIFLDYY